VLDDCEMGLFFVENYPVNKSLVAEGHYIYTLNSIFEVFNCLT
jgi:hypothetical protein